MTTPSDLRKFYELVGAHCEDTMSPAGGTVASLAPCRCRPSATLRPLHAGAGGGRAVAGEVPSRIRRDAWRWAPDDAVCPAEAVSAAPSPPRSPILGFLGDVSQANCCWYSSIPMMWVLSALLLCAIPVTLWSLFRAGGPHTPIENQQVAERKAESGKNDSAAVAPAVADRREIAPPRTSDYAPGQVAVLTGTYRRMEPHGHATRSRRTALDGRGIPPRRRVGRNDIQAGGQGNH